MPGLSLSMSEPLSGLAGVYGEPVRERFAYSPDSRLEELFGHPPLTTAMADRLDFQNDGDAVALIRRSMSLSS